MITDKFIKLIVISCSGTKKSLSEFEHLNVINNCTYLVCFE